MVLSQAGVTLFTGGADLVTGFPLSARTADFSDFAANYLLSGGGLEISPVSTGPTTTTTN